MSFLVIDDHTVTREILASLLTEIAPAVKQCASIEEAVRVARGLRDLELIVLDYDLVQGAAQDSFAGFSNRFPGIPVVVSGGVTTLDAALGMLEAGAAGYLPRTMTSESMSIAIKLVLTGERYVPSFTVEGRNRMAFHLQRRAPNACPQIRMLTGRQREVLGFVAQGAPNKVIARHLNLHEVTVKAHLRTIYRTLGVSTRTEAARTALLAGMAGDEQGNSGTVGGSVD